MRMWSTFSRWTAVTAAVSLTGLAAATLPAAAGTDPIAPDSDDWGSVVPSKQCGQADAWVARLTGLGKVVNASLFESSSPATPSAPEELGGGDKLVNLTLPPGIGLGVVSALHTRAVGDKLPGNIGQPNLVPAPCTAYAQAEGASVDVGLPYIASPVPGGTQMSPLGVHVDAISVDATALPGKPVKFRGGAAAGYISVLGNKIVDIPKLWPVNFGARIPADYKQPPFALASTNEQVTTKDDGSPTTDATGHYKYDPAARSGYVNAIHASVLGLNVVDATIGHAAVVRKGEPPAGTAVVNPPVFDVAKEISKLLSSGHVAVQAAGLPLAPGSTPAAPRLNAKGQPLIPTTPK